jgi:peptide deformylase
MIRKIITYPDPILKKVARRVEKVDGEVRAIMADMAETMYAGEGVGLAAPQVAESVRVIVIDVTSGTEGKGPGLLKMANPEIVSCEGEIEWDEGCLSVPELRVVMKRKKGIVVCFIDENNKKKKMDCDGLLAVAIQHEIDHLDGKLIIDEVSRLKREMYLKKVKKRRKESVL